MLLYFSIWMILNVAVIPYCDGASKPCQRRDFPEATSFVCECSASYCDTIERDAKPRSGQYVVYTSSKDGDRFQRQLLMLENEAKHDHHLTIDDSVHYQEILGFGGSFTDSATMNILNLSDGATENLLKSYFSTEGLEYSAGRVPIASCDFSSSTYSYADTPGDYDLSEFELAYQDIHYKIPVIRAALDMSPRELKLIASPWSAPAWMKTNGKMAGGGSLIGQPGGQVYQTWALYFVKFLIEYEKLRVSIWGMTIQNEPSAGLIPIYPWQSMAMPPEIMRDFVKLDLGPKLREYSYSHVKLITHDDNVPSLLVGSQLIYNDEEAASYLSGAAVHWYKNRGPDSYNTLTDTHLEFPDKFIVATEACEGADLFAEPVMLGSWERGERYSYDIIQDLNHWVTGWLDWNLALDMNGGPNWANNQVDSPIIVDAERDVFYKQPMFYHLGHFSKFVPPGSVRISLEASEISPLLSIAFKTPDDSKVAVILNELDQEVKVTLQDTDLGELYINAHVPPRSIQTYIW
ncbi:lysosomal acid glucosylceramidase-like [Asterias amurensis]|uniref:lysosomal acid glucosylceramidase-like n=1 Tax=Asterias amurensis TaxID=7602 RepID=UPI003AB5D4AC